MTAELLETDTEAVRLRLPRWRALTWDDRQKLPDDGRRYEIIDGSLHVSASPTPRHQVATGRLRDLLLAAAPDDVEVMETVDIDLGPSVLEPDVLVVRAGAAYSDDPKLAPADLLFAAEVVSRSSRRMDRMVKPSILAEAGVPAYWLVELDGPGTPAVVVHAPDGGVYREVVTIRAGEAVTVDVPFPVEVRPAELVGPRRSG